MTTIPSYIPASFSNITFKISQQLIFQKFLHSKITIAMYTVTGIALCIYSLSQICVHTDDVLQ